MKLTHYYVINKETGKVEYVNCRSWKAQEYMDALENKEQYEIRAKYNVCI